MKRRNRKLIKVFAILPHDMELSTQYCFTKSEAEAMVVNFYKGQAMVSEMEQFEDVIDRKQTQTARYGYGVR